MKYFERFYKTEDGLKLIECKNGFNNLSELFMSSIYDEVIADIVKKDIESVKNSEIEELSGSFNAHSLTILKDKIIIENIVVDDFDSLEISHEDFLEALELWLDFYTGRWRNEKRLEKHKHKEEKKKKWCIIRSLRRSTTLTSQQ